jgi:hypothetical protein
MFYLSPQLEFGHGDFPERFSKARISIDVCCYDRVYDISHLATRKTRYPNIMDMSESLPAPVW